MDNHKTTLDEAIMISKTIKVVKKIDDANFNDFLESETFEEYQNRRGIIDINEEEFNFLKNPKLKEVEEWY